MPSSPPKRIRRSTLSAMSLRPRQRAEYPGNPDIDDETALAVAVGREVRSLRRALDMMGTTLAGEVGISNGMLSKIESGSAVPSLATLNGLARALKVPVARFFAAHGRRSDLSLVRAGGGVVVQRHGDRKGQRYELLGHLLAGEMFVEPYLITLQEGSDLQASFQHTGVEFLRVAEGRLEYKYGDQTLTLHEGDSLLFDANTLHGPVRLVQAPVRLICVIVNLRV